MTKLRHLALGLAAAITMIVVCLMPSVAGAHAGHQHRTVATDTGTFLVGRAAMSVRTADRTEPALVERAEPREACASPCCGSGGHAHCCGCASGLVPAAVPALAPPPDAGLLPPGAPSGGAPVVPEALPEPPRPLA